MFSSGLGAQVNDRALFRPLENTNTQQAGQTTTEEPDSMLTLWYVQKALMDTTGLVLYNEEDVPAAEMTDSVYIRRLNNMPSIVSLAYNEIVRKHIVLYTQKRAKMMETLLGLSEYYLPLFEQILDIYGVPLEIRALPIIESALNPLAVSRAGATGMWQFMLKTGREHGLTITSYVDERRDPIASAHAAAKFLTYLYNRYNDWTLALAAYNCGAGNVDKAIKRAGGKHDYWEIYPYLPRETREYVPAFLAVNYALRYYKEHRLTPKVIYIPSNIDTFMINTNLYFAQISDVINIPFEELKNLNPQYKKYMIPGVEKPYELRIPSEYTDAFIENENRIYGRSTAYFDNNIVKTPVTKKEPASTRTSPSNKTTADGQQTVHYVQSGESLTIIASKYGIKLADLCEWNGLKNNSMIHPGQKLSISPKGTSSGASSDKTDKTDKAATSKTANGQTDKGTAELADSSGGTGKTSTAKTANKDTAAASDSKKTEKAPAAKTATQGNKATTAAAASEKPKTHTVKEGESLWTISQKYKVSFSGLLKANGMTSKSTIQPGQKLKLP